MSSTSSHDPPSSYYVPKSKRSWTNAILRRIVCRATNLSLAYINVLCHFILHQCKVAPRQKRHHRLTSRSRRSMSPSRRRFHPKPKTRFRRCIPPHDTKRVCCIHRNKRYNALTTELHPRSSHPPHTTDFGVGTFKIRIDNRCSYCVSNRRKHFVGDLIPINATVQGISVSLRVTHKGTVRWTFLDDLGKEITHDISNTLFLPSATECILSPQHWSQALCKDIDSSAHTVTDSKSIRLIWNNGQNTKTVPLDPETNVATMSSASSYNNIIPAYASTVADSHTAESTVGTPIPIHGLFLQ